MNKCIFTGLFLIASTTAFSQSDNVTIKTSVISAGKDLVSGKEINGYQYTFSERIDHTYFDSTSGSLTLQLRNMGKNNQWTKTKGPLMVFDLEKKAVKWSKSFNYSSGSSRQVNNILIETNGLRTTRLNLDTGEKLWESKNFFYYLDPVMQVGLAYESHRSNILKGIDLSSGLEIWRREIKNDFGWNDVKQLSDSTILLASAGLHMIHLKKGTGWDFDAVTTESDPSKRSTKDVIEIQWEPFAIITRHNLVRELVSNILMSGKHFYFASKENIVCLNDQGKIQWKTDLPANVTSKSSIFIKDSTLFIVNKGYASQGYNSVVDYGKPFWAAYRLSDGKQIFLNKLNNTAEQINGYKIRNDTLVLLFSDRMAKYALKTGTLLAEKSFEIELREGLDFFIGKHVYIQAVDSLFKSLIYADTLKYYVFTRNGKTIETDQHFKIQNHFKYKDIYLYYAGINNFKFLSKGFQTVVVDQEGKKTAILKASGDAVLNKSKLYTVMDNSFIEIDLKGLSKK